MTQLMFFVIYIAVSFAVSALVMKFLRNAWLYFLVAPVIPPALFIGGVFLFRGHLNAWSDVAFVISWALALACAATYFGIRRFAMRVQAPGEAGKREPH